MAETGNSGPGTVQDAVSPFLVNPLASGALKVDSPLIDTTPQKAINEEGGLPPLEQKKPEEIVPVAPLKEEEPKVEAEKEENTLPVTASDYKEYSDYALMALEKIEDGTIIEFDPTTISKTMTAADYSDMISKSAEIRLQNHIRSYDEKIGNAYKYVESLVNGVPSEVVEAAIDYEKLASIPLDNDDNIKVVLKANLQLSGTPEEDWEDIINMHFEKGRAQKRAEFIQKQFKESGEELLEEAHRSQAEAANKQMENVKMRKAEINSVIDKGEFGGITLTKQEQKELKDFLFTPSVYVDGRDGMKQKVTEFRLLEEEYKKSVEQQIAFAYFLKKKGKFDFAINKGSDKVSTNIRDVLNSRSGQTTSKKEKQQSDQYKDENYFINKN